MDILLRAKVSKLCGNFRFNSEQTKGKNARFYQLKLNIYLCIFYILRRMSVLNCKNITFRSSTSHCDFPQQIAVHT